MVESTLTSQVISPSASAWACSRGEDLLPGAVALPAAKQPVHGLPGPIAGRHVPPRRPGPGPPADPVDQLAFAPGGWPAGLDALGQQRLQPGPLLVGQVSSSHAGSISRTPPPFGPNTPCAPTVDRYLAGLVGPSGLAAGSRGRRPLRSCWAGSRAGLAGWSHAGTGQGVGVRAAGDLPRKNCWTIAEHAGDPARMGCITCWVGRCGTTTASAMTSAPTWWSISATLRRCWSSTRPGISRKAPSR